MRCYFHLVSDDEELIDDEGVEVSDLGSARIQALMAVSELQREYDGTLQDWSRWHLHIRCPKGTLLYSFPLKKALH
jgi:hypothetical protein